MQKDPPGGWNTSCLNLHHKTQMQVVTLASKSASAGPTLNLRTQDAVSTRSSGANATSLKPAVLRGNTGTSLGNSTPGGVKAEGLGCSATHTPLWRSGPNNELNYNQRTPDKIERGDDSYTLVDRKVFGDARGQWVWWRPPWHSIPRRLPLIRALRWLTVECVFLSSSRVRLAETG